jgi:hypothetical protein
MRLTIVPAVHATQQEGSRDMTIRKVVAGSVLAAGVTAGMFGAGTASAAPGISYDPGTGGTKTIGIGDQSATGATANAAEGNRALAISLFRKSSAIVVGGSNNNAFAFDGISGIAPAPGENPENNNVFTSYGATVVTGASKGNTIINAGGLVQTSGNAASQTSVSFCGTSLSGQADHITVGKMPAAAIC